MNYEQYKAQREHLFAEIEASTDVEFINAKLKEVEQLDADFEALAKAQANANALKEQSIASVMQNNANVDFEPTVNEEDLDIYASKEYRHGFMNYCKTGEKNEVFLNATSTTSDTGAVIPTTILNKIVEKMADYGRIYSKVTKTTIKGGVEIPLSTAKPTALWTAEGTVADKQKKSASDTISFNYYKLQVRVAVSLIADAVTLSSFEAIVADNVYEAMIVALETAIINGTGTGQPLGITKDTVPASRVISITPAEFGAFQTWTTIKGKVPRKYRNGYVMILNDSDYSKYIEGMVDSNGQPVARVTMGLNGTETERFLGKEVIATEDYLPSIDDATAGDVVGVLVRLSDYMLNSNLQMTYKRYFDEDTDEWISKSTLIADGKLSDRNGVVLIKKKA